MKYSHIVSYVANAAWAINPDKMTEIMSVLAFRAAGHAFTPQEIQARIGVGNERSPKSSQHGAVAIIPVRGVIANRMGSMDDSSGGTSCERISAMIDRVASEDIPTIVYDFDTPGGTVPGVQELAGKMFGLRGSVKQIAQINGQASSAGYWLASMCDEIVCSPSGIAGSIGVFTVLQDLTAALEKEGIKIDIVRAGKYKAENNPFETLSAEGRAFIQAQVDDAYAAFTKDVARGRGVSVADVRGGYGQGRALAANDALAAGLVDRIGTMEGTLAKLAGGGKRSHGLRAEEGLDLAAGEYQTGIIEIHEHANRDALDALAARGDEDRARRLRVL